MLYRKQRKERVGKKEAGTVTNSKDPDRVGKKEEEELAPEETAFRDCPTPDLRAMRRHRGQALKDIGFATCPAPLAGFQVDCVKLVGLRLSPTNRGLEG